jgi:diacylglycerol O-acyltransferase
MERVGGVLALLSARVHGQVFVSVQAYQPGGTNSEDALRQAISNTLADFSLDAIRGWPVPELRISQ